MGLKRLFNRVERAWPGKAERWMRQGRPAPPPHSIKVRNVLVLADLYDVDVLVETGTFKGNMIAGTLDRFADIYSIEINRHLARAAQRRFRRFSHKVHIMEGDSAEVLKDVIARIPTRALFWLDGHNCGRGSGRGSGETPILAEIEAVAARQNHEDVVIIDDARSFHRENGYPELDEFVERLEVLFSRKPIVADDAIFVLPGSTPLAI